MGAPTGARLAGDRAQDRHRGVRAGEHVGGLEIRRTRRGLVALLEVHEPRHRVDDVREGRARAPGAGLAEARDRAVDDVGLQGTERRVVAAQSRHDAGHEVLDDDVGHLRQVVHDRLALGLREIDADALLAGIDSGEIAALVAAAGLELQIVAAHLVALAGPLDLDHAGAQVAEQPGAVGSGQDAGQIQDGDADQRQIVGLHESSSGIVRGRRSAGQARLTPPPRSAIVSHQLPHRRAP